MVRGGHAPRVRRPGQADDGKAAAKRLSARPLLRIFGEVAESFFGSLKNEWYSRFAFKTRAEARVAVIWYIESFYNRMRPHSTVGWRKPAELMAEFLARFDRGLKEAQMAA